MPPFEVTWIDARGNTQIDCFMEEAIARRAVADLRYYNIRAWISARPSHG